jgi:minimal PKS chain-length factor (CLF/KS beta)
MSAVITGLGVVAPNGIGADAYWAATLAGQSGIGPITLFDPSPYPARVAGEVRGFDAGDHLPSRLTVQTDRWTHHSMAATEESLADAGIRPAEMPEYEMGVITATSSSGGTFGQRELASLWSKGPQHVTAYQSIAWFYAATTGQISIRHGMRGPTSVLATEQAGGLDAVAHARRVIRAGQASMVISGGTDASLAPYGIVAQLTGGLLSTRDDPARAYLPFDRDASGFVPGEGGAIVVVEDDGHARERGAHRYCSVAGHAATFDPVPGSGRPPALGRAVLRALRDAGAEPADVDVVFADAMANVDLDRVEAEVLREVFGARAVPVTAPKTMTGRLYAGGAALDLATAALSLRDQVIPPTVGVEHLAPWCELDLVGPAPRSGRLRTALVIARGYHGFNAAMVLRACDEA